MGSAGRRRRRRACGGGWPRCSRKRRSASRRARWRPSCCWASATSQARPKQGCKRGQASSQGTRGCAHGAVGLKRTRRLHAVQRTADITVACSCILQARPESLHAGTCSKLTWACAQNSHWHDAPTSAAPPCARQSHGACVPPRAPFSMFSSILGIFPQARSHCDGRVAEGRAGAP